MSARDGIEALLGEVTPTLRDLLRRAYELGYREAIAHAPVSGDPAPNVAQAQDEMPPSTGIDRLASDVAPSTPAPVASAAPAIFRWDEDSVVDDDDDDGDNEDEPTEDGNDGPRRKRKRVGIRPSSTVGSLKTKIEKEYRLDRFAIDVVLVRAGDRDRRQLPSNAQLGAYLREE